MKAIRKFLKSLRVFKRLRMIETDQLQQATLAVRNGVKITTLEAFIDSREPCDTCGHHRYRQKTLHRPDCG